MGENVGLKELPRPAENPTPQQLCWREIGACLTSNDPEKGPQIFANIKSLSRMKATGNEVAKEALKHLFNDKDFSSVREELVKDITAKYQAGQWPEVFADIILGRQFLDADKFPTAPAVFQRLEEEHDKLIETKATVTTEQTTTPIALPKRKLDARLKVGLAATAALSGLAGTTVAIHPSLQSSPKEAVVQTGTMESLSSAQAEYQVEEVNWPTATSTAKPTEASKPLPTATDTPKPSPPSTETPKPTSTPETKIIKKDLLREKVIPIIYHEVLKIRDERAKKDPEYLQRINPELNQDRINLLLLGGRKDDKLSDSLQILSYHIPSHSLYMLSIPRDLQSPEVLKKSGSPQNSRINQAVAYGGIELAKIAMENATGLSMDLAAIESLDVLVDLIDKTVGSIELELDKTINDPTYPALEGFGFDPFYISAGKHKLDGATALKVARSRHDSSDYIRSERQQKIAWALFEKILKEGNGPIKSAQILSTINNILAQKVAEGALKPDFDLKILSVDKLLGYVRELPSLLWTQAFEGGWRITSKPNFFSGGISNKNFVVEADVPGLAITKIRNGNPYSSSPRKDYWQQTRQYTEQLMQNTGEAPPEEEIKISIFAKEERILHPQELPYGEVKRWIGMLRDSHDSVLSEPLFTQEIANLSEEKREEVLQAITHAHVKGLIEHYGDTGTIIGLDPGHGGTDIGSSGKTPEGKILAEKDLTWQLSQMIAEEIYKQTNGKYTVVFLRPENPQDTDLDRDGIISPIERIQKRKALLLQMEEKLRPNSKDRGKNIVYLSIHFNGSPDPNQKGAEGFWPNETAVYSQDHRDSSKNLAQKIHQATVDEINKTGYEAQDRGTKEDPDKRQPMANAEPTYGPYIVLGSAKLDRDLEKV